MPSGTPAPGALTPEVQDLLEAILEVLTLPPAQDRQAHWVRLERLAVQAGHVCAAVHAVLANAAVDADAARRCRSAARWLREQVTPLADRRKEDRSA